jgi:hypothetical protein
MKLLVIGFLHPPVTPSLFGPNILLSTLLSNTLSLGEGMTVSTKITRSKYLRHFVESEKNHFFFST